MRDVVIIPLFARPEYLQLCLEHLEVARAGRDLEYWVFQDRHTRDNALQIQDINTGRDVVNSWKAKGMPIHYWERQPHAYVGNVLNHMEAYLQAYNAQTRYVYHVEDDVFVAPDFFDWHEAVQEKCDPFVSVGWHCIRNPKAIRNSDPTGYIESALDLSSIGMCWKRQNLTKFIQHATPAYYEDHAKYMYKNFPNSPIPCCQWTEQAGLIFRVMLSSLNIAIWPTLARCSHVGVSGYHRPGGYRFEGPLESRVEQLRAAAAKTNHIVSLTKDPFDDIAALAPIPPWTPDQLHCVQHIEPPSYPHRTTSSLIVYLLACRCKAKRSPLIRNRKSVESSCDQCTGRVAVTAMVLSY